MPFWHCAFSQEHNGIAIQNSLTPLKLRYPPSPSHTLPRPPQSRTFSMSSVLPSLNARLLPLTNTQLRFYHVFPWSVHFFLLLNSTPLSGWTTLYLVPALRRLWILVSWALVYFHQKDKDFQILCVRTWDHGLWASPCANLPRQTP